MYCSLLPFLTRSLVLLVYYLFCIAELFKATYLDKERKSSKCTYTVGYRHIYKRVCIGFIEADIPNMFTYPTSR